MAINFFKILILAPILFTLSLSNNSKHLHVEVDLNTVQHLSLMNKKKFPELNSTNYNDGYIELEECIELEIKSNVPWMLIAKDESKLTTDHNFQIRVPGGTYKPINLAYIELISSTYQTSRETIKIDCKRLIGWDATKPGKWNYSPAFELIALDSGGTY